MLPEDRLDTLLSLRVAEQRGQSERLVDYDIREAGDLEPLLAAADRVTDLADEEPSEDFAARLEAIFLSHAAHLRERDGIAPLPILAPPPLMGNDEPTLPSMLSGGEWAAALGHGTWTETAPGNRGYRGANRQTVWRRLLWPALAATLLLAIGMTTFTAAALAGPGSPLYGLHKWEQNLQVNITGSAADRTQLHISNAQDALLALNSAVASHQTGTTYDDALAAFRDEARAATTSLDNVPAGGERDALTAQLDQLHTKGIADLHTALPLLSWPQRVETTGALSEIGDQVLTVTQANMVYSEHGQHLWTITVSGSGFQPGAVLLMNGQPVNATTTVTPTKLIAQMPGDDSAPRPGSIGVGNPDNTAAATTSITSHEENDDDATPGAQQTPGSDDHGGDHHGSSGGSATPTGTGGVDH
ncbi:MAG TPA: IPT/TIG domain-containing protein [Ktedonobacterales bacterium]|nr:IPT/TIG domain-containing protein [Ktedonobacterales bacterium]